MYFVQLKINLNLAILFLGLAKILHLNIVLDETFSFKPSPDVAVQIATDKRQDISKDIRGKQEASHRETDNLLSDLKDDWPHFFQRSNNTRLKSVNLFKAILASHRTSLRPGSYFWEEVKFYSELIESFLVWLHRELYKCAKRSFAIDFLFEKYVQTTNYNDVDSGVSGDDDDDDDGNDLSKQPSLHEALHSFSYLMTSMAYLGAEQAMCSSFHSVVCFSHTETYHYANYTFSAEALFRLYKLSLINLKRYLGNQHTKGNENKHPSHDSVANTNGNHEAYNSVDLSHHFSENENEKLLTNKWSSSDYKSIFPELSYCRQEILADLDSVGAPLLPSNCNQARRNDTNINEVNVVVTKEFEFLTSLLERLLIRRVKNLTYSFFISTSILICVAVYIIVVHLLRYAYIKFKKPKLKRKKKQVRSNSNASNNTATLTSTVNLAQRDEEAILQQKHRNQSLQQIPAPPPQPLTQSNRSNLQTCLKNSTLHINHVFSHDPGQSFNQPTSFSSTPTQQFNQTLPMQHHSPNVPFLFQNHRQQQQPQQLQARQPHHQEMMALTNHGNTLIPNCTHLKADSQQVVSIGALKVASV